MRDPSSEGSSELPEYAVEPTAAQAQERQERVGKGEAEASTSGENAN